MREIIGEFRAFGADLIARADEPGALAKLAALICERKLRLKLPFDINIFIFKGIIINNVNIKIIFFVKIF
jgi:hypothetical protein